MLQSNTDEQNMVYDLFVDDRNIPVKFVMDQPNGVIL